MSVLWSKCSEEVFAKVPKFTLILSRAETRRFELLKGLTPYLVSSEAHSTGLCDVSKC